MHELDWIRQGLADRRVSFVAKKTGLSEPTIRDVRDGKGNPTLDTLQRLGEYLTGQGE